MRTNVILVKADGPYYCQGDLVLRRADGSVVATAHQLWLCRCGLSREKPYCDGSHTRVDLHAERLHVGGSEPLPGPAALSVRTRTDGPLKLEGPCEVRAEDGTLLMRGTESALCRCGQSKRKPFCDGTHRRTGFEAP